MKIRKGLMAAVAVCLFAMSGALHAQQAPEMPAPSKEHQWLERFVGEWETSTEIFMEPGKEPMKASGTESARMVGGFWVLVQGKNAMGGMSSEHVLQLGYDAKKGKYVGSWIDSMSDYIWKYEGTVDASGKKLTLETEGSCLMFPGKIFNFREVTEFASKDHRVFTSSMQGEDGQWTTLVRVNSRRK